MTEEMIATNFIYMIELLAPKYRKIIKDSIKVDGSGWSEYEQEIINKNHQKLKKQIDEEKAQRSVLMEKYGFRYATNGENTIRVINNIDELPDGYWWGRTQKSRGDKNVETD